MSTTWNLWHGCKKVSAGCQHCYVYRRDAEFGKDSSIVTKTKAFDLPIRKDRKGNYKVKPEDGVRQRRTADSAEAACRAVLMRILQTASLSCLR